MDCEGGGMEEKQEDLTPSREGREEEKRNWEELSAIVVDCACRLHVDLEPGLLGGL